MWKTWIKYYAYVPADVKSLLDTLESVVPSSAWGIKAEIDGKDLALMGWINTSVDRGLLTEHERQHILAGIGPHI